MAKTMAHFTVARSGDDYLLTIEDDDGDTHEFTCDYDKLDLIVEAVEEQLDRDEEDMLEVDEGEEEMEEE